MSCMASMLFSFAASCFGFAETFWAESVTGQCAWKRARQVTRLLRLVIAECEAEARADAANGFCTFSQDQWANTWTKN